MVLYLTENIINEAVSGQEVVDAIDHRNAVVINYAGEKNTHTGKRYIEPYVYGTTTAGNQCIRAYQYWGDTKRGVPKWKIFLLDRITSWEPTDETFELEPKARGWAAQAYNKMDKSMSEVFKTVDFGEGASQQVSDLERLRARTRQLQNGTRLNIKNLSQPAQQPEERPTPNMSGPVTNDSQPQQQAMTQAGQYQEPQETSPVMPDKTQPGPITGDATNPEENKPEDLMSNDQFRDMLMRNLERTRKEKEKRNRQNNLVNA